MSCCLLRSVLLHLRSIFIERKSGLLKVQNNNCIFSNRRTIMDLCSVVSILKSLAPLELAEDWDNVGLLIEPLIFPAVTKIMLTIDLTKAVLREAIRSNAELIVAYHPPIFKPMKNLYNDNWKNSIVVECLENGIAVYSPHTALDSVIGGINDSLLQCFDCQVSMPINEKKVLSKHTHHVKFQCSVIPYNYVETIRDFLPNIVIIDNVVKDDIIEGTMKASESDIFVLNKLAETDYFNIDEITDKPPGSSVVRGGLGKQAILKKPITVSEAIEKVKKFLHIYDVRVSLANYCCLDSLVKSVAVCAGSGAGVLREVRTDLYVTGEMSHHELINAAHRGTTVILTEHSNSERHFLKNLAKALNDKVPEVITELSVTDKDPIMVI